MSDFTDTLIERIKKGFDNGKLPEYMWGGIERYLRHGIEPGGFLAGVLSNDLQGTFARADMNNEVLLKNWVVFMFNDMPVLSRGSKDAYDEWLSSGGLAGYDADE